MTIENEPKTKPNDRATLAALSPRERRLVEDVRKQHPALTIAEAIEALRAAGM